MLHVQRLHVVIAFTCCILPAESETHARQSKFFFTTFISPPVRQNQDLVSFWRWLKHNRKSFCVREMVRPWLQMSSVTGARFCLSNWTHLTSTKEISPGLWFLCAKNLKSCSLSRSQTQRSWLRSQNPEKLISVNFLHQGQALAKRGITKRTPWRRRLHWRTVSLCDPPSWWVENFYNFTE